MSLLGNPEKICGKKGRGSWNCRRVTKIDIFGDRKHESFERKTDASGATNDTLDRAREKKPAERLWVTGLNLQVNHQRRHHPGDALDV